MRIIIFELFLVLVFLLQISCSSVKKYDRESYPAASAGAAREEMLKESESGYYAKKSRKMSSGSTDKSNAAPGSAARLVIYSGEFAVVVENVQDALKGAEKIAERFGGFIESAGTSDSYRLARVVIRVPVKSFQQAIKEIEKMGDVTSRKVTAQDVTREFNDTSLRMKTLKEVRSRLYELLRRTKDVKEQVKILKEIERLTLQIDSMMTRLDSLKNRAAYSTLVLTIKAKVKEVVSQYLPSPFGWIRKLSPWNRSVTDDYEDVKYKVPDGFFDQKDEYYDNETAWLLTNPGGKVNMRISSVKNYPPADLDFWKEAFCLDAANRKYKVLSQEILTNSTGDRTALYNLKTMKNNVYSVAFAVRGESLIIMEALYEDEKIFKSGFPCFRKFCKESGVK